MRGKERRWKAVAVLAVGVAIGVSISATPAVGHVAGWVHNWNTHIKPRADARYVNVGETATNADLLDGLNSTAFYAAGGKVADSEKLDNLDSSAFMRVDTYRITDDSAGSGETEHEAACNAGDRLVSGGYVFADAGTFISGSWPNFLAESWVVRWVNDGTPDSIRVFALCANQ